MKFLLKKYVAQAMSKFQNIQYADAMCSLAHMSEAQLETMADALIGDRRESILFKATV